MKEGEDEENGGGMKVRGEREGTPKTGANVGLALNRIWPWEQRLHGPPPCTPSSAVLPSPLLISYIIISSSLFYLSQLFYLHLQVALYRT